MDYLSGYTEGSCDKCHAKIFRKGKVELGARPLCWRCQRRSREEPEKTKE